jgi:uncharacterized protein with NAD-binding domain and iron-sulfur cluster
MRSPDSGTIHIVGAGLAGLAAAVRLADSGRAIVVHEATRQPGGALPFLLRSIDRHGDR